MSTTPEAPPDELDFVRDLRTRSYSEGAVFWIREGELGVFEPEAAQKVNALNFHDLALPDKLADVVRGRTSEPFSWKEVRATWLTQLRRMSGTDTITQLGARMDALLAERLDRPINLSWMAQEVCTQALVPIVVAGLTPADTARVLRDQDYKLRRLMTLGPLHETFWTELRSIYIQVSAGMVVRRELRGRAKGKRPRQLDLADPIVDLLPELGLDRAIDAVTSVLTAIAGPPGAVAACMLYELTRRPDWAARLTQELESVSPEDLQNAPARAAPVTHRFVKEALRMWSPPILMTRPVRTDIQLDHMCLKKGQRYLVSSYLVHRDPRNWKDPDVFDPDRWLPDAPHGPRSGAHYVPFGWAPTTCIGAGLGTTQLMLLCHLMTTRYRIVPTDPAATRMVLAAIPLPKDFQGTLVRR